MAGLVLVSTRHEGPEGLIAFKLQSLVNNPRRTQDLEYIRAQMLCETARHSTWARSQITLGLSVGKRC